MKNNKDIITKLTLEDKAAFCIGKDFWHLRGHEDMGLPSILVSDGPHGLRVQAGSSDHLGLNESKPATCFPLACATACSFDRSLLWELGEAIGKEARDEGVSVVLGPGINIKRNPLCGRNFEYFSEDPYLAGELGAGFVKGVQSQGVGTSVKHFAVNNQERARMVNDSIVDDRALREIYLYAFEIVVKKAAPYTIMTSYNLVNGTYASESKKLIEQILRAEWGFMGAVITDWGGNHDRVKGIVAGQDLEMPGPNEWNIKKIVEAVKRDILKESDLEACVKRVIRLIQICNRNQTNDSFNVQQHHTLARRISAESSVLLKNQEGALPVKDNESVAIIGEFAVKPRYQGAGSSRVNPTVLDSPLEKLKVMGQEVEYAAGYDSEDGNANYEKIKEAVELAKRSDKAVIFAGLPSEMESEGFDRSSMAMPEAHNILIESVAAVNNNTIVILMCGAPVELPWRKKVKAILLTYLGGQAVGGAIADLLTGKISPSGKLPESWPEKLLDVPSVHTFADDTYYTHYKESIFVGYRWYDTAKKEVAYPFGHGLTYTEFEISEFRLSAAQYNTGDRLSAQLTITNIGQVSGAQVVQLYIGREQKSVFRAKKELKGFEKVFLHPGESQVVCFDLDERSFAYYNLAVKAWSVECGSYSIMVGVSSREIISVREIEVNGDSNEKHLISKMQLPNYFSLSKNSVSDIPTDEFETLYGKSLPVSANRKVKPFTVSSTVSDLEHSYLGKMILSVAFKQLDKMLKGDDNQDLRKIVEGGGIKEYPLRMMALLNMLSYGQVLGLIEILNGHYIRGIRLFSQ